jgi:hypothetical protein
VKKLGPKLARCIHIDGLRPARLLPNVADIAAVAQVRTGCANTNNVIGHCNVGAGKPSQRNVEATGSIANERTVTDGRVEVTGGVESKRTTAHGRVGTALGVSKKRTLADGRVGDAGGIVIQRLPTNGRVFFANGVAIQRTVADGGVVVPKSVAKKRIVTDGRVVAGGIKSERGRTDGRVGITGGGAAE